MMELGAIAGLLLALWQLFDGGDVLDDDGLDLD